MRDRRGNTPHYRDCAERFDLIQDQQEAPHFSHNISPNIP